MKIVSIQVGMPRKMIHAREDSDGAGAEWESGIFKESVPSARLGLDGLEGDGQADLRFHGGPDRALLAYSADHYAAWSEFLGREIPFGGFGENLTLDGGTEEEVCLGDVYQVAEVRIEVSQPRLPCYKLARRLDAPGWNTEVARREMGGWYARTLSGGEVSPGQILELVHRPHPEWTVRRAFRLFMSKGTSREELKELMLLPALSQLWKDGLRARLSSPAR